MQLSVFIYIPQTSQICFFLGVWERYIYYMINPRAPHSQGDPHWASPQGGLWNPLCPWFPAVFVFHHAYDQQSSCHVYP